MVKKNRLICVYLFFLIISIISVQSQEYNCNPPQSGMWVINDEIRCENRIILIEKGFILVYKPSIEDIKGLPNKDKKKIALEIIDEFNKNSTNLIKNNAIENYDLIFSNVTILNPFYIYGPVKVYIENSKIFSNIKLKYTDNIISIKSIFYDDFQIEYKISTKFIKSEFKKNLEILSDNNSELNIDQSIVNGLLYIENGINYLSNSNISYLQISENSENLLLNINIINLLETNNNQKIRIYNSQNNGLLRANDKSKIFLSESIIKELEMNDNSTINITNSNIKNIVMKGNSKIKINRKSNFENIKEISSEKGGFVTITGNFSNENNNNNDDEKNENKISTLWSDFSTLKREYEIFFIIKDGNYQANNPLIYMISGDKLIYISNTSHLDLELLFNKSINKYSFVYMLGNIVKEFTIKFDSISPYYILIDDYEIDCNPVKYSDWHMDKKVLCYNREIDSGFSIYSNSSSIFINNTVKNRLYVYGNSNLKIINSSFKYISCYGNSTLFVINSKIENIDIFGSCKSFISESQIKQMSVSDYANVFIDIKSNIEEDIYYNKYKTVNKPKYIIQKNLKMSEINEIILTGI